MKILITRWQPLEHAGDVIASFNFRIDDVITVRAALFSKRGDRYHVTMPFTRHKQPNGEGVTAVGLGGQLFHDVLAAVEAHYLGMAATKPTPKAGKPKAVISNWLDRHEPDDAGLKRTIRMGEAA